MPYEGAVCGCDGTWQGAPLTLEVDHMDGDYRNNAGDNLRFLCRISRPGIELLD